ncbi:MAG: MotA/TolQ/ExbB proton channel family protein [Pirellulaceae bacterium]|nr:MotA/TolQ/ExbB proton channel family protein [Pirellulaceae bacterium]
MIERIARPTVHLLIREAPCFIRGCLLLVLMLGTFAAPVVAQQPPVEFSPGAAPSGTPSAPPKKAPLTFFQIVFSGGPLGIANMLALIGLSLTAAFLVFDNLLLVRKSELIPDGLSDEVRRHLAENNSAEAIAACKEKPGFLSFVLLHGLAEMEAGWSEVEKGMEDAIAEQAARLFRRIEYLSVIGNIAPMVGLLGTVTGMLLAFKQVAETEGSAGAAQLADGIYQALVTTVVGLIIAIPALGAFALFRSRVDQLVAEAAYAALHGLSPLKQRRAGIAPPAPPPPPPPRGRG